MSFLSSRNYVFVFSSFLESLNQGKKIIGTHHAPDLFLFSLLIKSHRIRTYFMPLWWKTAFLWLIYNPFLDHRANAKPFIKIIEAPMPPYPTSSAEKDFKRGTANHNSQPTHPPKTITKLPFNPPLTSILKPTPQGFDRIHEAYRSQQHNTPKQPNPKQALGYQPRTQTQTLNQPKQRTQFYAFSQPSKTNR